MKLATSCRVMAILLLALGASLPAGAQTVPKAEVSGGYQLLTVNFDEFDETLGTGWYADVAGNLGSIFSVVFQVSGNYKTFEETESFGGVTGTLTASLTVHEFMGGVRVNARKSRRVTPFGQLLVGGVSASAEVEGTVTLGGETIFERSERESSTNFGLQVGGGATIWLGETIRRPGRGGLCNRLRRGGGCERLPGRRRRGVRLLDAGPAGGSSPTGFAVFNTPPPPRDRRSAGRHPRRCRRQSALWCRASCPGRTA